MGVRPFLALAALALLAAGCSSGGPAARQTASPRAQTPTATRHSPAAPLSARVLLPARTMTAGSSMSGLVLVENNTGHPVRAFVCGSPFEIALISHSYRPSVAWNTCLQIITIPVGESSYPVTLNASYLACLEHGPHGALKGCLAAGGPPPLPPGTYRARLFQVGHLVPVPPTITIRVTPPRLVPKAAPHPNRLPNTKSP